MTKGNALCRNIFFFLLVLPLLSLAQTSFHVTGQVHEDSGKPIVGATVTIKGTKVATTTGEDGSFSIDAPSGKSTLVITFVGYEEQQIDINNRLSITVSLTSS